MREKNQNSDLLKNKIEVLGNSILMLQGAVDSKDSDKSFWISNSLGIVKDVISLQYELLKRLLVNSIKDDLN